MRSNFLKFDAYLKKQDISFQDHKENMIWLADNIDKARFVSDVPVDLQERKEHFERLYLEYKDFYKPQADFYLEKLQEVEQAISKSMVQLYLLEKQNGKHLTQLTLEVA